jgi:hypothetical protein
MDMVAIVIAFIAMFIGGYQFGRISGARTMAISIVEAGTNKYGKDFKKSITVEMEKQIKKLKK